MPREVFVAGQVLTAAELNVVSDQSVMVFAGTAARGSAIPSPTEGMVTYRSDDDLVEVYNGSSFVGVGGKILNVYSEQMTATQSMSAAINTYTDLTGLSITLTPTSTSSKFWILGTYFGNADVATVESFLGARVMRDATEIVRSRHGILATSSSGGIVDVPVFVFDAPNTASSITYKLQAAQYAAAGASTYYANRNTSSNTVISNSFLTIMEVAG